MSKTNLSDFAQQQRHYIDARCEQPFKNIAAPETEFKLFEARMQAIDSLEKLYEKAEQELASMRSTLERLEQSALRPAVDDAVSEAPRRTKPAELVQPYRHLNAA